MNNLQMFKVVWVDGYNRESVADRLIVDMLTRTQAEFLCEWFRFMEDGDPSQWFRVYTQEAKLWRGMEEFI